MKEKKKQKNKSENAGYLHGCPGSCPHTKGGCIIATLTYEDPEAIQVKTLRNFRDEYLTKRWWGKIFINLYYGIAPTLVLILKPLPGWRKFLRKGLDVLCQKKLSNYTPQS